MKKLLYVLLSIMLLTMIGCGSSDSDDTKKEENKSVLTSIILSADNTTIEADGIDSSTLSVVGYDQDNNEIAVEGVKYFNNGKEVSSPFKTNNVGDYTIVARVDNLESNEVIVTASAPDVKLAQAANILETDELSGVVLYDSASKKLTFTEDKGSNYSAGDFLVTGISANFPTGLLAKVTATEKSGDNVVLTLEDAQLTDVIEDGKLSYHVDLKQSDVKRIASNYNGVTLRQKAVRSAASETDMDFVLSINSVIYDADGNTATTDDQIKANGELTIDPGIDISFEIAAFTIKEFTFGVDTNITGNVVLSGNVDDSFEKEIVIADYEFPTISIPLGPVPIILTPSMDLVVGAKGEVHGQFRCGISQQATAAVSAGYTSSNGWGGHNNLSNDFDYSEPEIKNNAGVKVYTGAVLKLALYSDLVAAGYGKVLVYFKTDADINDNPWWCIKGGIESVLGFEGLGIGPYEYTIPIFEKNIVCADSFGDGAFDPDKEVEKGWAKQYEIPTTFFGDTMNLGTNLLGVVSNGQNGFITIGSEPYYFSRFFEFAKDGVIGTKKFVKRDKAGEEVFHSYGVVKDGSDYLLVGIGGLGLVVAKMDSNGNHIWAKTYSASITLSKPDIAKLSDNKFIVYIGSEFVVFNSSGTILNSGSIKYNFDPQDVGEETVFVEIAGAADYGSGYFIVASYGLFPRAVILKYDNNDNLVWSHHVGIPDIDYPDVLLAKPSDVVAANDGSFYMTGLGNEGSFVAKFNSAGQNLWLRIIAGSDDMLTFNEVKLSSDGGVLIAGTSLIEDESGDSGRYVGCVAKFSQDGVFAFAKTVSDEVESIELNGICERDDGNMFAAVGYRTINGTKQPFIMTMNRLGEVVVGENSTVSISNLGNNIITNLSFDSGVGGAVLEPNQVTKENTSMKNHDLNINLNQTF